MKRFPLLVAMLVASLLKASPAQPEMLSSALEETDQPEEQDRFSTLRIKPATKEKAAPQESRYY
jgi:hypothetical protein